MVSVRCIELVKNALDLFAIDFITVELGVVNTEQELCLKQFLELDTILKKYDLEIIQDNSLILVEKIKSIIFNHLNSYTMDKSLKQIILDSLDYDYQYIGRIFSKSQGITLHRFIILSKVEKVKQLLRVNELNISEIANRMSYSSVAHLSYQFKVITGYSPTAYRSKQYEMGKIISITRLK